jgi:hypothetical protein
MPTGVKSSDAVGAQSWPSRRGDEPPRSGRYGWAEPAQVFTIPEQLQSTPQDAAGNCLAGMASDGQELLRAIDPHNEVDVAEGMAVERCAVLAA